YGPALDPLASVDVTYEAGATLALAVGDTATIMYNGSPVTELTGLEDHGVYAGVVCSENGGGVSYLGNLLLYGNQSPDTPSISQVAQDNNVPVVLIASAFADDDSWSTHGASQWQIALFSDRSFTSPVYDSGEVSTALERIITNLQANRRYRARVRYQDDGGLWSGWSNALDFFVYPGAVITTSIQTFPTTLPNPRYPIEETWEYDTQISDMGSGWTEKRRARKTTKIRHFRINYRGLSQAHKTTLADFHDSVKGAWAPFYWTHPFSGTTYLVRFKDDRLASRLRVHTWEDISFVLKEATA
ncbi:MAG TPA: hypothetical protein PKV86_00885, partial [Syntrophobacteraceae bacterium]|nr:hypothetical protein [Syntrophobacteraceae bacterium]